ncbi:Rad52/22 family double-strand break repair protein-domain-containing protein [Phanerochaete sordida]|uniref:Rad52/22 family double-strand break repair protein-domain-containing protein n=1 Tax=Phanerochaete sordida TaxID=48140 RepID=A0A9P3GJL6_9APHY|nr:Rad52/22 family double-strand break repair protein-domain-containing protein [Phanerochaete sordida]
MAGSFSGHLIDSFLTAQQQSRGPFGQNTPADPPISVYGAMSFAPSMHGSFGANAAAPPPPVFQDISEETAVRIATLQAKLNKKLGPEFVSQRPGPGGGPKLTYVEGWKALNLANDVFGYNGWSSNVVSLQTDYIDHNEQTQRFNVGVTAIVRVTLRDGVYHEDIGYGMLENSKSKGAALDKCKKEAVTDGMKRALRNFGNLLGNCLYDKSYTQEVVKMKVVPPKFDPSELHRRPECDPNRNNAGPSKPPPAASSSTSAPVSGPSGANNYAANQSAPQPMPPPPHAQGASGTTTFTNNSAPSKTFAAASSSVTNATTSGHAKGSSNLPAQNSTNNQPQHQPPPPPQQRPGSRIIYEPKTPAPQPATTSATGSDRRVSFAPAPQASVAGPSAAPPSASTARPPVAKPRDDTYEEEDSYGLHSEDDAFYAAIDLGDGAADLGPPIHFEGIEEFVMTNCSLSDIEDGPSVLGGFKPPPAAAQPAQQQPQQQPQQQNRPSVPQQSRPGQQPRYSGQSNNASGQLPNTSGQQPGSSSTNQPVRSSQAASGAFHFPKGPNQSTSAKPPSGSGTGIKRPADAMREPPARRPAQGMGLAHASGSRREPLAMIDVVEGGDFKRAKR